ncbi:MAG: RelA/SpoT family protein [Mucinivorans sp.]
MENDDKAVEQQFEELLSQCSTICKNPEDYDLIRSAYEFARDAHRGVKRKSGEPYITHPLSVARIVVAEIGLGVKSVVAALLHDVVEDTDYTVEDIRYRFGDKVAQLVDGLTKLSGVFDKESSEQAENFKRMLLTLSDDVRVIIIKLADRLHNMRTLGSMLPHKQMKIASETIYLFAPLANRLGLYSIKCELEDLSLKFRFPEQYAAIEEQLYATSASRQQYIERFNHPVIQKLTQGNIKFEISARVKSVYSIWKKMKQKQIPFEEIYDLFAVRVVFDPIEGASEKSQCWSIYSLVTDVYRPKMDRIRDWVGTPKANGYEALHCTVMGPEGIWAEVQIRSRRMDDIAERGVAAHWRYKGEGSEDSQLDPWIEELREALGGKTDDAIEFLDNFKIGLEVSEIMVFTPKGESRTIPKGSTALDFAYAVHSKIGSQAIGAKINHRLSSIYTPLSGGDQIEIITSASVTPKLEWLDHVISAKAKTHIRQALRRESENAIKTGQELFETRMRELDIPIQARVFRKVLPAYKCIDKRQFYSLLGSKIITLDGLEKVLRQNAATKLMKYWTLQISRPFRSNKKNRANIEPQGSQIITATCCNPIPGDEIIGFERSGGVVEVHKRSCPEAIRLSSQQGEKIVGTSWGSQKVMSHLVVLNLRGIDRKGVTLDIVRVVSEDLSINIRAIEFASHDGIFEGQVSLYIRSNDDLKSITDGVSAVKGVEKVTRVENQASEKEIQ